MRFSTLVSSALLLGYAVALPAPSKPSDSESTSVYASSTASSYDSSYTSSSNSGYDNKSNDKSYNSNKSDESYDNKSENNYDNKSDSSYNSKSDSSYDSNTYDSKSNDKSYSTSTYEDNSYSTSTYEDNSYSTSTYEDKSYSTSTTSSYDSAYTSTYESSSDYTSTTSASESQSTNTYGSGYWGGSGYNDCVQQCVAQYGGPSESYSAPTSTQTEDGSYTGSKGTGATITVIVAPTTGVFRFVPPMVNASVGDTIEYHWRANKHTVTKSSALELCNKTKDALFDSGTHNESFVFTQAINDTNPIYYYCATPNHCPQGMFGMVNTASSYNSPSSASQMISVASANSSDMSAMQAYVDMLASQSGDDKGKFWGSNIDMSGLPDWAMQPMMESIMYTRAVFAANPDALNDDGTLNLANVATMPKDFSVINNAVDGSAVSTSQQATSSAPAAPSSDASSAAQSPAANTQENTNGAASTAASSALFGAVALAMAVLAF